MCMGMQMGIEEITGNRWLPPVSRPGVTAAIEIVDEGGTLTETEGATPVTTETETNTPPCPDGASPAEKALLSAQGARCRTFPKDEDRLEAIAAKFKLFDMDDEDFEWMVDRIKGIENMKRRIDYLVKENERKSWSYSGYQSGNTNIARSYATNTMTQCKHPMSVAKWDYQQKKNVCEWCEQVSLLDDKIDAYKMDMAALIEFIADEEIVTHVLGYDPTPSLKDYLTEESDDDIDTPALDPSKAVQTEAFHRPGYAEAFGE